MQTGDLNPGWELIHPDDSTTNAIRFENKTVGHLEETDLKGPLVRVRCEENNLLFMAYTGSPTLLINQKTVNQIMTTVKSAKKIKTNENDEAKRMVCYKGYKIPSFGRVIAPIESSRWTIKTNSLIVVDDRSANTLGRNLLAMIGVQLQWQLAGKSVNAISDDIKCSDAKTINWVKSTYPGL